MLSQNLHLITEFHCWLRKLPLQPLFLIIAKITWALPNYSNGSVSCPFPLFLSSMQTKNQAIGISDIVYVIMLYCCYFKGNSATELIRNWRRRRKYSRCQQWGGRWSGRRGWKRKKKEWKSRLKTEKILHFKGYLLTFPVVPWAFISRILFTSWKFLLPPLAFWFWYHNSGVQIAEVLLLCREPCWDTSWNTLPCSSAHMLRRRGNYGKEIKRRKNALGVGLLRVMSSGLVPVQENWSFPLPSPRKIW